MRHPTAFSALAIFVSEVLAVPAELPGNATAIVKRVPQEGYDTGISWTSSTDPIVSLDGNIGFYFQTDGNFVVYNVASATPLWNSGTSGHDCTGGKCLLAFQNDGNLVAYDGASPRNAIWSTGTNTFTRHEIPASGLFFRNTDPYLQLYSQSLIMMLSTHGETGIVVQNPDVQNDPLHDDGQPVPSMCHGATVNCAQCFQKCDQVSSGQLADWGSNAKTFGDTDPAGTGPYVPNLPSPVPPNPCDEVPCEPNPCVGDPDCDPYCIDDPDCGPLSNR